MSRVPRSLEHLKTGFASEAASAAHYRAYAARAQREGMPNLARRWGELAAAKDELAILQLEAAGQVRDEKSSLADALAEERFENDVLYPKMIRDADEAAAETFRKVVSAQKDHAGRLAELRDALAGSRGDLQ